LIFLVKAKIEKNDSHLGNNLTKKRALA